MRQGGYGSIRLLGTGQCDKVVREVLWVFPRDKKEQNKRDVNSKGPVIAAQLLVPRQRKKALPKIPKVKALTPESSDYFIIDGGPRPGRNGWSLARPEAPGRYRGRF